MLTEKQIDDLINKVMSGEIDPYEYEMKRYRHQSKEAVDEWIKHSKEYETVVSAIVNDFILQQSGRLANETAGCPLDYFCQTLKELGEMKQPETAEELPAFKNFVEAYINGAIQVVKGLNLQRAAEAEEFNRQFASE